MPIAGDDVARRPQAVAIEAAGRVAAVGQHDAGGPVPGLELAVEELVEGAHVRIEIVDRLPGRRHQDAHGLQHVHAAGAHDLEHIVEARRVRAGQRDDRIQVGNVVELVRHEVLGARHRPVAIALDRIDLAVVGEKAERLRKPPLRQRVGREALVKQADRGLEPRVAQVREKVREHARHDHALVADRHRRQARDVGIGAGEIFLGAAPAEEQAPVEAAALHAGRRIDVDLLDPRQRLQRLLAAHRRVRRHLAPARDFEPDLGQRGIDGVARRGRLLRVLRQEYGADGKAFAERKAEFFANARRNAYGNLISRPQPSPVLPSAATAPRCVRRASAEIAVATTQ